MKQYITEKLVNFDSSHPTILYTGSKFTVTDSWTKFINNKLRKKYKKKFQLCNIAQEDASLDQIVKDLNHIIPLVSPVAVFIELNNQIINKREIYFNNTVTRSKKRFFGFNGYLQKFLNDERIINYNIEKNFAFLDLVLKKNAVKAFIFSTKDFVPYTFLTNQHHSIIKWQDPMYCDNIWNIVDKDLKL